MRIKLDENLGRSAPVVLREAGYEAERLSEEGLSGYPDEQIRDFVWKKGSQIIKEYSLETLKGCLAIADEYRTRIRRPKT